MHPETKAAIDRVMEDEANIAFMPERWSKAELTALIDERIEMARGVATGYFKLADQVNDAIEDRAVDVTIENLAIVREQKAKMMALLERAYDIIACGSFEHGSDAERDSTQWVSDYENLGGNMKDSNG